jgi:pimeloyl-ACP methyl ester carboxylesterase
MTKIIFLYGFTGSKKNSITAKRIFSDFDFFCFEYDSSLRQPLEKIAGDLGRFIDSKTNNKEKINLIGVSAGGIIASYYAKFISPKKVNKLATICSPFKGSYVALFYPKRFKGLKQLFHGSEFLKELNSRKIGKSKTINFYSFFDILVPFNSGKGENPKHTLDFFHFTIQNNKKILRKIKKFFDS